MPRRFGQHFLIRQSVLDRIARFVCPGRESLVIEIGPGRGALTRHLLDRADRVIAIELDAPLTDHLRSKFPDGRLDVIQADVLGVDLTQWAEAPVAGNLPYYITSPIIEKVIHARMKRAVFLVQKEVAQRLAAKPGSRDFGFLSVHAQLLADVELLFTVPPAAFAPPPKVDSALVRLSPRDPGIPDAQAFLAFAGLCFRQKRKTLRNNLRGHYAQDRLMAQPEANLRAEQLSVAQLLKLYERLAS